MLRLHAVYHRPIKKRFLALSNKRALGTAWSNAGEWLEGIQMAFIKIYILLIIYIIYCLLTAHSVFFYIQSLRLFLVERFSYIRVGYFRHSPITVSDVII